MPERIKLVLSNSQMRLMAHQAINCAPEGYIVEIFQPTRSNEQSAVFHILARDVSKQVEWGGKLWPESVWKTIFVAALFNQECVPALEGNGYIIVNAKTSRLTISEMSDLIELVRAFGAEHDVSFSD